MVLMVRIIFLSPSGPEHGGSNGVGIENIGGVYNEISKDANPGLGEDPFVFHRLRAVRRQALCSPIGVSMAVIGSKSAVG